MPSASSERFPRGPPSPSRARLRVARASPSALPLGRCAGRGAASRTSSFRAEPRGFAGSATRNLYVPTRCKHRPVCGILQQVLGAMPWGLLLLWCEEWAALGPERHQFLGSVPAGRQLGHGDDGDYALGPAGGPHRPARRPARWKFPGRRPARRPVRARGRRAASRVTTVQAFAATRPFLFF